MTINLPLWFMFVAFFFATLCGYWIAGGKLLKEKPFGWKRDPEFHCDGFEQIKKDATGNHMFQFGSNPECETDGHYMCDECVNARRCECNGVLDSEEICWKCGGGSKNE